METYENADHRFTLYSLTQENVGWARECAFCVCVCRCAAGDDVYVVSMCVM